MAVACVPLALTPTLPLADDLGHHVSHARSFADALGEGVLLPRWMHALNFGLGAPSMIFYSPLGYYPVALAWLATHNVVDSFRIVLCGAFLFSALVFYLALRRATSDWAAALGAAIYVLLPYYAIDLYQRFAFVELLSFAVYPALFYYAGRVARSGEGWQGVVVCYAVLVLLHLVTAYIVLIALVPWCLILAARGGGVRSVARLAGAGAIALVCAGVFLLPLLAERELVHLECLSSEGLDQAPGTATMDCELFLWEEHFLFAGNAPSPGTTNVYTWLDGIALAQLLLTLAAGLTLWLRTRRVGAPLLGPAWEGVADTVVSLWIFLLLTPLSEPIWRLGLGAGPVQFPWRLVGLQSLLACRLVALALAPLIRPGLAPAEPSRRAFAVIALAALPALALTLDVVDRTRLSAPKRGATERRVSSPRWGALLQLPYMPREVDTAGAAEWRNLKRVELRGAGATGRAKVIEWRSHERRVEVQSAAPNLLALRAFVYPGWRAWLDGEPVDVEPVGPEQRIGVRVPAGNHVVEVRFGTTPARSAGAATSALGLLLLGGLTFVERRRLRAGGSAVARGQSRSSGST